MKRLSSHCARAVRPFRPDQHRLGDAVRRQESEQLQPGRHCQLACSTTASSRRTCGAGFLVSKESYTDFEIKVEFWSSDGGNSGVYMRCMDGTKITDKTCYEANVFDKRPDQSGRTGGIPNFAQADRHRRRRRQVEYLRNHHARPAHRRRPERHQDDRHERQRR